MSNNISIGGVKWKLTSSVPATKPYLKLNNGTTTKYAVLKTSKPSMRTLRISSSKGIYYVSSPEVFIGSGENGVNLKYSLSGDSGTHLYNDYYTWNYTINGDENLVIMCNTGSNIRGVLKKSYSCNDCDECTGGDRYRSQSKSTNTEELQDSYRKFFEKESPKMLKNEDEISTFAATVSPPVCYDGAGGSRPNGGCHIVYLYVPCNDCSDCTDTCSGSDRYSIHVSEKCSTLSEQYREFFSEQPSTETYSSGVVPMCYDVNCGVDRFMDMPAVTAIDADTFTESYVGSVNFKKEILFSSLSTSWTTIFSYYPFRHAGSSSDWLDNSYVRIHVQVMRSGQTLSIRRWIETALDQAASSMRGQHWFISNKMVCGVHTK